MKAMTPEEWFDSDLCKNENLWLNIQDYVDYVLNIAAKKAEIKTENPSEINEILIVDKNSIINCLKD